MISEIKHKQEKITFPCLMKSKYTGCVVLFFNDWKGTVVYEGKGGDTLGDCCEEWDISSFELFTGVIELKN